MKRRYIEKNFRNSSMAIIEQANEIVNEYSADGYDLTLRQLYYQFVARGQIANSQREYKRLGSVINDARLAGLVDWNSIVDRTRNFERLSRWDSPADILRSAAAGYHIDLRSDQDEYIEVWVEKDALVGVVEKACKPLDVGYLSCRGYVSQSVMWRAAQRFIEQESYYETTLIHLGDHDPSGIDMTRDIQDRLELFGASVIVKRVGLTMAQVEELQPPPNPAKTTDSRYKPYIAKFGNESWELDALDPRYLVNLITDTVEDHTNEDLFDERVAVMVSERKEIENLADNYKKGR